MADISIIARRLKNGNVEYGWGGAGAVMVDIIVQ